MRKRELIKEVAKDTGYQEYVIKTILDSTINEIKEAVANNNPVTINGFATFSLKLRNAARRADLIRRTYIIVPARKVPHVKLSRQWFNATK